MIDVQHRIGCHDPIFFALPDVPCHSCSHHHMSAAPRRLHFHFHFQHAQMWGMKREQRCSECRGALCPSISTASCMPIAIAMLLKAQNCIFCFRLGSECKFNRNMPEWAASAV